MKLGNLIRSATAPDTIVAFDRGMAGEFNATDTAESTKGLKAGVDLTITGGSIQVDSLDDALHSDDSMTIAGGSLMLATGDDGLHSESSLTIQGGELTVTKSYVGSKALISSSKAGRSTWSPAMTALTPRAAREAAWAVVASRKGSLVREITRS